MTIESGPASIIPALFGLVGTLVGAGLTYHSAAAERRSKQDDDARTRLSNVSSAIERLAWVTKVGAVSPDDVSAGPEGITNDLIGSARSARVALLSAGIPYRLTTVALDPAERLALRWGQRRVLSTDPRDAQAAVEFLFDLLNRGRLYRRSQRAWSRLQQMDELGRARRPLDGVPEDSNLFGQVPPPSERPPEGPAE